MRAAYYEVDPDEVGVAVAAGFETADAVSLPRHMRHGDYGASIEAEYRAGRTLLVKDTEVEAQTESERAAYRAIGVRAWVGVPLVENGRLEVILGVHSATPREWTRAEIELLEEVAARTWAAVERARAEAALRESEVRARRAHDLIKGIVEATDGSRPAQGCLSRHAGPRTAQPARADPNRPRVDRCAAR
jgi:GAF domain-containing protein